MRGQPADRRGLPLVYAGAIVLTTAIALVVLYAVIRPPIGEFAALACFLSATAAVSIVVGYAAYRFGWLRHSPRLALALLGGYALSSILTFLNVWVTARLMFASEHDLLLATVLLLFAGGIAMSVGYFLSASLTDRIVNLSRTAEHLAQGHLNARAKVAGNDELASLARTFNDMAAELEARRPPANIVHHLMQQEAKLEQRFVQANRNDPCPCGSGRKFKHCHGKKS